MIIWFFFKQVLGFRFQFPFRGLLRQFAIARVWAFFLQNYFILYQIVLSLLI